MIVDFIDTSVLVAAVVASEPHHTACGRLLDRGDVGFYIHGLAEFFSTLTGGRKTFRLSPQQAVELLEADYLPLLQITTLTAAETLRGMRECPSRGVQGGAIFDYLHLVAARKGKAERLYALNISNFRAFHRDGDPEIRIP
ncbi:MAG: type II toxin-antitoxin system VapC family toxin [Planctomycetes bacterium]|nr:type II toxin-antitoxin system VapC family toxin [Planctomycetota bacterium]